MTQFLIDGRGTGKSQAALRWVRGGGNRYLILPDSRDVDHMLAMDRAMVDRGQATMPLHPEKFVPYAAGATRHGHSQTVEYAVDGIDTLLTRIFGRPVGFVTATGSLFAAAPPANIIQIGG